MDIVIGKYFDFVYNYNWNSPISFLIVLFGVLILFRQWKILLPLSLTIVLGCYFHEWIILNIKTFREVVTLPVLIYCTGGALTLLSGAYTFLKYMLR